MLTANGRTHRAEPTDLPRVLVVDDDATTRDYLRLALEKSGHDVTAVEGGLAARLRLSESGPDYFDCVVTDYQMPEFTGLDLLLWLKEQAPSLATIMLTAQGERKLVADSLRGGAADFLEKPVNLQQLRESVGNAIRLTRQRRHALRVESAVKDLGMAQQRMLHLHERHPGVDIKIGFHPMLEAGGDAFSHFQTGPGEHFCLLTDVAGHDLQAAYLSAYFQGVVRGMRQCGRPAAEIFQSFNRHLLEEWSRPGAGEADHASVAACAVAMNLPARTVSVLTCGGPSPVLIAADGRARFAGEHGGFPLGWFPDFPTEAVGHTLTDHDQVALWTDGVEDLAETLRVHPLTLGHRLLTKSPDELQPELKQATDDILFTCIHLTANTAPPAPFSPLILERYHGGMAADIDQLESGWARNLKLALPKMSEATRHNILLASREAVLNSLQHGCQSRPEQSATYQLSVQPENRVLRIWVDDPGPGHDFDHRAHEATLASELPGRHLGLVLIHTLAQVVRFERNRASIIMDFYY